MNTGYLIGFGVLALVVVGIVLGVIVINAWEKKRDDRQANSH